MIFAVRKRFDNEAKPLRAAGADGSVHEDAASVTSANGNGAAH